MLLKISLIALPVFLFFDALWLGLIAKNFYAKQLGSLMKTEINWWAAIIFYLLFVIGLAFFVIGPAVDKKSLVLALIGGALFGLICYATYDLTNLATLKNWPIMVTLVDLLRGTILSATVAVISYIMVNKIFL